jgi:hypothetical protein
MRTLIILLVFLALSGSGMAQAPPAPPPTWPIHCDRNADGSIKICWREGGRLGDPECEREGYYCPNPHDLIGYGY